MKSYCIFQKITLGYNIDFLLSQQKDENVINMLAYMHCFQQFITIYKNLSKSYVFITCCHYFPKKTFYTPLDN